MHMWFDAQLDQKILDGMYCTVSLKGHCRVTARSRNFDDTCDMTLDDLTKD